MLMAGPGMDRRMQMDMPPLQSLGGGGFGMPMPPPGGGFQTGGPDYGPPPPLPSRQMPLPPVPMPSGAGGSRLPPMAPQGPSMRDRFGAGLRTFGAKFGPQPAGGGGGAAGPGAMTGLQSFGTALAARRKAGAPRLGFGRKPPVGG